MFTTERKILHKDRKQWSDKTRFEILVKADFKCVYCHTPLTLSSVSLDHDIPLSRGGEDDPTNLVACCRPCNTIKNHLTGAEFRARGGRKNRTFPYGERKSRVKTGNDLFRRIKHQLDTSSRTRDVMMRMFNGERVDAALYPPKISESRGRDMLLPRLYRMARRFPHIVKNEGTIFWIAEDQIKTL